MNFPTFVICVILVIIVALIIRSLVKKHKNGGGCGCGCSGCSKAKNCADTK